MTLVAAIVLGLPILIGPSLATVGWSNPGWSNPTYRSNAFQSIDLGEPAADRGGYARMARDEMRGWRRRLQDFIQNAEINGNGANAATVNDLATAWSAAEAASRELQVANFQNWRSAQTSYEKASDNLATAWRKLRVDSD